ncbi:MAG: Tetratricopeptide repeat protein [Firmicutes bacterium ADurb.Bin373]|nr:MAG: Tetratricopeptide repeat protein [Firmicutes bacterium ADurb.Bin373]
MKNLEGAYQDFTEAIRRRPDEPVFFINRAKCAFYLGRMESAKEDSDKAISLDPGNSVYWGQRGYLLFALKEFREAADCFAAASRFDPQPQYLMMRARAFLCLGDRVKAREVLTEVTEAFGFRTILANRQAMSSAAVLN